MTGSDDEPVPDKAAGGSQPVSPSVAVGLDPTTLAQSATPSWLGRVLDDRYRITSLLGEGGMGAVFVAEHLALHKEVALKVVRAELAGNGEVATRFAREAMATAQFEHPHVASAIDYGTLPEGGAYFVMQLVRGTSLRGLLARQKRLTWRKACELLAQVADALSAARAAEIIHRDLKPDNILVEAREDGSDLVKVLDFGIAYVAPRDAPAPAGAEAHRELTRIGTVMGTPGYMSPEQAVGDKVDHRTDLYALGVVLWESITGKELWEGPDLTSVITRQLSEPVPRLRDSVDDPSIPLELDELVRRLTARKADDRPEHAGEVRDTLRRLAMTELSAPDWVAPVLRASGYLRQMTGDVSTRFQAQPREKQRKQMAIGAAAGAFAIMLAMAGLSGGGDDAEAKTADAAQAAAGAEAEPPAVQTEDPKTATPVGALGKAMQAAREAIVPSRKPSPPSVVPAELEGDAKTMLEGTRLRDRRDAAERIARYREREALPPHLLRIAEFELARGCRMRKDIIDEMVSSPHPDYLPPLRRIAGASKTGCGFLSLEDCYSCVRADVRRAIAAIRDATGTAAEATDEQG